MEGDLETVEPYQFEPVASDSPAESDTEACAEVDDSGERDVQDCQQRLSSAFDLLLIFLCSLIQTLTLTPPPNNALLANMAMCGWRRRKTLQQKMVRICMHEY